MQIWIYSCFTPGVDSAPLQCFQAFTKVCKWISIFSAHVCTGLPSIHLFATLIGCLSTLHPGRAPHHCTSQLSQKERPLVHIPFQKICHQLQLSSSTDSSDSKPSTSSSASSSSGHGFRLGLTLRLCLWISRGCFLLFSLLGCQAWDPQRNNWNKDIHSTNYHIRSIHLNFTCKWLDTKIKYIYIHIFTFTYIDVSWNGGHRK